MGIRAVGYTEDGDAVMVTTDPTTDLGITLTQSGNGGNGG